jgi:cell division initiation protein
MALTPQDIQSQQFHIRFRGFDVDEVDDFLEKVSEDYLTVIQENKQLRERLEDMKNDLNSYRGEEKSFQKAIVSAQQIAEQMKEKSERQAEELVANAREEAERLVNQAHQEITVLEKQLDSLKARKSVLRDELRTFLQGYITQLDEIFENELLGDESYSEVGERQSFVAFETEDSSLSADFQDQAEPEEDFYEKVDLTDDFRLPEEDVIGDDSHPSFDMTEKEEAPLPELDGEMIFSLDDPLDDLTPDIRIKDGDKEEP